MATNGNPLSPYPTTVMVGLQSDSTPTLDGMLNFIESTTEHDDHATSLSNMTDCSEDTASDITRCNDNNDACHACGGSLPPGSYCFTCRTWF